jgi:predicted dithiol-disulfide oxidoreductase (DUF899 family)
MFYQHLATRLDAVRRKLGQPLASDVIREERHLRGEAADRVAAMRRRLQWQNRYHLYLFDVSAP